MFTVLFYSLGYSGYCVCVCLSVCLSATSQCSVETVARIELACGVVASFYFSYSVLKGAAAAAENASSVAFAAAVEA